MIYKSFAQIIETLKQQQNTVHALYGLKVNLIDYDSELHNVIDLLLEEVYGKEGKEWIHWFVYEKPEGKDISAWDENGKPICYSVESLWEHLEKCHKK